MSGEAEPRPCYVLDVSGERLPGHVLAWVHDDRGWHAVVRYSRRTEGGWTAQHEHSVPAEGLEPRTA